MNKKPAFTLLELLIVITIAGILTSVLVLNFNGVKERQEMLLLADQSVAMLQKARSDISAGKMGQKDETSVYLCEGVFFEVGEKPIFVSTFYDDSLNECDFSDDSLTLENFGINADNAYTDYIVLDDLDDYEALYVLFLPNDTGFKFYNGEGIRYTDTVQSKIGFGGANLTGKKVEININALTFVFDLNVIDE